MVDPQAKGNPSRSGRTAAGRASAAWNAKSESRHLPAWWEWLNIRLLTRQRDWTPPQRKMMRKAGRFHALRGLGLAVMLAALTLGGLVVSERVADQRNATHSAGLVRGLLDADTAQVPGIIAEIDRYRRWSDPLLRQANKEAAAGSRQKLHTSLALLRVDEQQTDYLYQSLLDAGPGQLPVIRDVLREHREVLAGQLWGVLSDERQDAGRRFRAACALAGYDSASSERWRTASPLVVAHLLAAVQKNPSHYTPLLEMLRPIRSKLLAQLSEVYRGKERSDSERSWATTILADYAADRPEVLADLLMDGDDKPFAVLYPKLKDHEDRGTAPLAAELDRKLHPQWIDPPLNPAWQQPDASLVKKIESAHGIVAERFALCQTMPLETFLAVAEELRPCGYRPVRLRPYTAGKGVQAAVVWTRDGTDWHLAHGLSAERLRQEETVWQRKGYVAVDVAGYPLPDVKDGPPERYVGLWKKAGPGEERRLYVGVSDSKHTAEQGPLKKAGFVPLTVQALPQAEKRPLYSSVWGKDSSVDWNISWEVAEENYSIQPAYQLAQDVSVVPRTDAAERVGQEVACWFSGAGLNGFSQIPWYGLAPRGQESLSRLPGWWYAGVWHVNPDTEDSKLIGLAPDVHLTRCRELMALGYRPAALAVCGNGDAQPLVTASVWHRRLVPDDEKETLAKRQANAAAALLRLGHPDRVWPLFAHRPDPRARSYLIHRLAPLGVDPGLLVARLEEEKETSIRRAVLLSLGEFGTDRLPAGEREKLIPRVLRLYQEDSDAGVHASAEWLLRQWKQEDKLKAFTQEWMKDKDKRVARIDQIRQALPKKASAVPSGPGGRWYVNTQGQTMVVVPGPVTFRMGSPLNEADREGGPKGKIETPHQKHIGRTFAIAAHEVTVGQFRKFRENHDYGAIYSPTADHPVSIVTWYDAAAYCNWLSEQEGIPDEQWCYEPKKGKDVRDWSVESYGPGMRLKANYLSLEGYRLPSEAEWEYACRAGATTSRYYGETEDLLGRYAWYTKNSLDRWMLPPGSLKPNDLGLFDMLGNALEWCQERNLYYNTDLLMDNDEEDIRDIGSTQIRVLRGGAFSYPSMVVRSAGRYWGVPAYRLDVAGLRPARTFR